MSHINERWVAIDGSVYTEEAYLRQVAGGEVKYRPGIAFNVGQMVAEHMVRLHNASLNPRHIKDVLDDLPAKVLVDALVRRDETFRSSSEDMRQARLSDESISAVVTLKALGYTYHGGEQWKPPLGKGAPADPCLVTGSPGEQDSLFEKALGKYVTVSLREIDIRLLEVSWLKSFNQYNKDQEAKGSGISDSGDTIFPARELFMDRIRASIELVKKLDSPRISGASDDLPPPHDSLEEAQRAAGMSSVMQSQGSSLRPVEIGQAVVAAAPKPCCGCGKG